MVLILSITFVIHSYKMQKWQGNSGFFLIYSVPNFAFKNQFNPVIDPINIKVRITHSYLWQ